MTDEQTHPDPVEDPDGYAAYQAEHEDDEATRVRNAKAAAKADNAEAKKAEAAYEKWLAELAEANDEAERQLQAERERQAET
jgi:phytoene dehydrogenase-like protein